MEPFNSSLRASELKVIYPEANHFVDVANGIEDHELKNVLRLWISEGIPAAFKDCPIVYESTREWLADKIGVHPKTITIVGSSRLGYSLKPSGPIGRPFHPASDLDYSIVCGGLYAKCRDAAEKFIADVSSGALSSSSERKRKMWERDVKTLKHNFRFGFIQQGKVPNLFEYEATKRLENVFWTLGEKLKITRGAPQVKKASYRVYKDWQSFEDRVFMNLRSAFTKG